MAILEGLDKINWSQLHHAYGDASNVPTLIRKLLSQDEGERDEAEQDLFNCICHQGTIWEATSYAVPFLWELVKSPETPDKLKIIFLLASFGIGRHSFHGILEDEKRRQNWTSIMAKSGKILEDEVNKGQAYEEATHLSIAKELSLFYPYLFDDLYAIRDRVAHVFQDYPEFRLETLPLLEKALASENNIYAKKTMENSIKILSEME